ncbi:hypothetical protein GW17_00040923 [Ensete ventricosum]|nr:hypothetical protein GW17_00040923 [Ensete ventricosum]
MAGTGASICMLGKDLSKMCRPHKGMDHPDLGHLQKAQDTEFSHGEENETIASAGKFWVDFRLKQERKSRKRLALQGHLVLHLVFVIRPDDDDDDDISIRQWLLPRSLRYLGSRKQRLSHGLNPYVLLDDC